jgi:hypothetical protein
VLQRTTRISALFIDQVGSQVFATPTHETSRQAEAKFIHETLGIDCRMAV